MSEFLNIGLRLTGISKLVGDLDKVSGKLGAVSQASVKMPNLATAGVQPAGAATGAARVPRIVVPTPPIPIVPHTVQPPAPPPPPAPPAPVQRIVVPPQPPPVVQRVSQPPAPRAATPPRIVAPFTPVRDRMSSLMAGMHRMASTAAGTLTASGMAGAVQRGTGQALKSAGGGGIGPGMKSMIAELALMQPEITAVVAAFAGMAVAAGLAANSLIDFRKAQLTSGGTTAETARIGSLGNAIGMSQGDMAGLSRNLASNLSSGGLGTALGAQQGLRDVGPMGSTDKTTNLLKTIDILRQLPDEQALRFARALGVEPLLRFRDVSSATMRELASDAAILASISTQGAIRDASEFQTELARVGDAFSNLTTVLGKLFMPIITSVLRHIADSMNALAGFLNTISENPIIKKLLGMNAGDKDTSGAGTASMSPQDAATDANTKAIKANTDALKQGTSGGGVNMRGAIPAGWTGATYNNWSSEAARLGAFAV